MDESENGGAKDSSDEAGSSSSLLRAVARAPVREPPPTAHVAEPRRIAHFRLDGRLGKGGMGIVYRAWDESLQRTVAIKVLPLGFEAEESHRARFLREARAAAALNHPNLATVYEVGESEGRIYIVMEHVEGRTLRTTLDTQRPPLRVALTTALEMAAALAHAHSAGVIHRDLKPENVMLADGRLKVLDFGLAKRPYDASETATAEGQLLGTPAYMSPEQARGEKVTPATDVFALGVILHEMLTGHRPFAGKSLGELLHKLEHDSPPLASAANSAVPSSIDALLAHCLEKDPTKRIADGAALHALLAALSDDDLIKPLPLPKREVWIVALLVVAAIAVFVVGLLLGQRLFY